VSAWLALTAAAQAGPAEVAIGYLAIARETPAPVSPLDVRVSDEGLQGARLGIADNATTGRFTGQAFRLEEHIVEKNGDPRAALEALAAAGLRFVLTDLDATDLVKAASSPAARGLLLLNVRATDDALRGANCSANVLHVAPSRAMLADALAQYLVWKRWKRWFLVVGPAPEDRLYADAVRRAAGRFGADIVVEKPWAFRQGSGRADTGHVTLQTEIPAFTNVIDHDVLVVADETSAFGDYLEGRTARPRPAAGTQGLVATAWSPVSEQWGATQLQSRFAKQAGRRMGALDYAAWVAVRSIGEAAVRSRSTDAATIAAYMRGPEFALSAFKGQGQSFRAWDGQMRQPILIAGPRLLVSVSPQAGFLHRTSELDTLGVDREESACRL
jgi:ABC transporter substrate binding protein (PQQ-dependent alcohol dehydrogenase system)